jgi:stress response protein YsnF
MTSGTDSRVEQFIGCSLVNSDHDRIGEIKDVYLDERTGQPEWFAVRTGMFGNRVSFVPIARASWDNDDVVVRFSKQQVKDSPNVEPDGALSETEEADLYAYYGMSHDTRDQQASRESGRDDAMTRSEEEVVSGTRKQAAGRARLVKYVETEHVNVTVPVQRERARVVTEPITDANRDEAMSGPDITEATHEETLFEEEPVVETRAVPKERVRLEKETVTEERDVGADVRKERIDVEGDVDPEGSSR